MLAMMPASGAWTRPMPECIGLDLDNTIIDYRAVFLQAARAMRLCPPGFIGDKTSLRSQIRALPDGERRWTELQAEVYGRRLSQARAAHGALHFVRACIGRGIPTFIVSHKTRFAAADPGGVDLHAAALTWLERHGFIAEDGLSREQVFFEPTRAAKLVRIGLLGCTSFVDDLREVFDDPEFPPSVERLLLGPAPHAVGPFDVLPNWTAIACHLLSGEAE